MCKDSTEKQDQKPKVGGRCPLCGEVVGFTPNYVKTDNELTTENVGKAWMQVMEKFSKV